MTDSSHKPPEPPKQPEKPSENQEVDIPELTSLPHKEQNQNQNQNPENPVPGFHLTPKPNMYDLQQIKSAQRLILVANIAGPLSLFIGGILLGSAGLVCGIIAYCKLNALSKKGSAVATLAGQMKRSSIISIIICATALIFSAISLYYFYPELLALLEDATTATLPTQTWG